MTLDMGTGVVPIGTYGSRHAGSVRARRPRASGPAARERITADAIALSGAVLVAAVAPRPAEAPPVPEEWVAAYPPLTLALLGLVRVRPQLLDDLRGVMAASAVTAMAVFSLHALVAPEAAAAAAMLWPWLVALAALLAARTALHVVWRKRAGSPTLIVGAGRIGRLTACRLGQRPDLGLQPVGFLDPAHTTLAGHGEVLGGDADLEGIVGEHGVEHLILTFSPIPDERLVDIARRAGDLGLSVSCVPRLFELMSERLTVDYVGGLPLLTARQADPRCRRLALKHALDRAFAAFLLLALALPLAAISLGVWASLGRPILFRQCRVGRDGAMFELLKFRSLRGPVDAIPRPCPSGIAPGGIEAPERRAGFGALLRRASLDELPQLVNVVRGEMCLVGPRPERPEYVGAFERTVHRYGDRHRMKSGITGWAQVHGLRGRTSLTDRVEWDNFYIENWSFWLDLKILLMTPAAVAAVIRCRSDV